ncbi:amino acid adenylation domain-containing protein [Microbispora sp. CA-102843]|uniref:amino acid adenylation domain-containing protein n=1 Tax=Microbispora sp. CA-102843 TaxID=3239952 RepID=UPI003D8F5D39
MTPLSLIDVSRPLVDEVVSCVAQVLGIDEAEVDCDARLTELGLESFTAVRLRRRLRERTGVDLPIASFLGDASVRAIAKRITENGPAETQGEPFPLTPVQSAYWVGRDPAFPLGGVATFFYFEYDRLPEGGDQEEDLARLERAWNVLVDHHPMLRMVVGDDGMQRILTAPGPYRFGRTDLRASSADETRAVLDRLRAERSHQLRPTDTWPLYDVHAALLADGRTRLFVGMDILALDMASWLLIMRQWGELVTDPTARPAPCATDFPTLVRERAADPEERERLAKAGAYWSERAETLPPGPVLPLGEAIENLGVPRFVRHEDGLTRAEWAQVRTRAAEHGLSPTGLLLAAFALTLHRRGAAQPFCLNVTLFDRPDRPGLRDVAGDFTTTALVAVPVPDLARRWTFAEWAAEVNRGFWADLEHRAVSGVEVLRAAGRTGSTPVHPVVFTSGVGLTEGKSASSWLGEEVFGVSQTPQVLLDHIVRDDGGPLRIAWDAVDALPADWVRGCLDAEVRLLRRLIDPVEWSSTTLAADPGFHADEALDCDAFPGAGPLLDDPWIQAARREPASPALLGPGKSQMSHGEMAEAAGRLAARLAAQGVTAGTPVAVALDKGFDQITAVLAVAALGAWYVPVEPAWPAARVTSVCERAGIGHAIATDDDPLRWPGNVVVHSPVAAEGAREAWAGERPSGGDLAYAIFTSGSTGTPKGVAIEHRAARTTVDDIVDRFSIGSRDRVLGLSALSFDLSVFDVFGVLGAGGALVLPEAARQRDPEHWLDLIDRHAVTVWNTAPALLEMLVEYAELDPVAARRQLRSLRLVMLSGDWIPVTLPERLRALAPQAEFFSLGGATEASIWSICFPVREVDPAWRSIPYGRALRGQWFRILDERGVPVPLGETGELYIGGDGLARGYVGDAEQTAERFATHPVLLQRLYRTGDLGRWRPDGTIEFLGRVDRQVKIRGHRIELGEVETVLAREPGVRACVAAAVPGSDGRPRLAAYIVAKEGETAPSEDRLTARLRERLPSYMVPARLVVLDRLPVTANGKVDHAALPNPYARATRETTATAEPQADEAAPDASLPPDVAGWAGKVLLAAAEHGLEVALTVRPGSLGPVEALSAAAELSRTAAQAAKSANVPLRQDLATGALIELRAAQPLSPAPGHAPRLPMSSEDTASAEDRELTSLKGASGEQSDSAVLAAVTAVLEDLLDQPVDPQTPFFQLGATSLTLVLAHRRLRQEVAPHLSVLDLFERPTARALAAHIFKTSPKADEPGDSTPPEASGASTPPEASGASTAPSPPAGRTPGGSRLRARAHAEEVAR